MFIRESGPGFGAARRLYVWTVNVWRGALTGRPGSGGPLVAQSVGHVLAARRPPRTLLVGASPPTAPRPLPPAAHTTRPAPCPGHMRPLLPIVSRRPVGPARKRETYCFLIGLAEAGW